MVRISWGIPAGKRFQLLVLVLKMSLTAHVGRGHNEHEEDPAILGDSEAWNTMGRASHQIPCSMYLKDL